MGEASYLKEKMPQWAQQKYHNSQIGDTIKGATATFEHPWQFIKLSVEGSSIGEASGVCVGREFFESEAAPAWCGVFFVNRPDFAGQAQYQEYRAKVLSKRQSVSHEISRPTPTEQLRERYSSISENDPLGMERGALLWYLAQREGPKSAQDYALLAKTAPLALKRESLNLLSKYYPNERTLLMETAEMVLNENTPKNESNDAPPRLYWMLRREAFRVLYACGADPAGLRDRLEQPTEMFETRQSFKD